MSSIFQSKFLKIPWFLTHNSNSFTSEDGLFLLKDLKRLKLQSISLNLAYHEMYSCIQKKFFYFILENGMKKTLLQTKDLITYSMVSEPLNHWDQLLLIFSSKKISNRFFIHKQTNGNFRYETYKDWRSSHIPYFFRENLPWTFLVPILKN